MEIGTILTGISLVSKLLSGELFGDDDSTTTTTTSSASTQTQLSEQAIAFQQKASSIMQDYDLTSISTDEVKEMAQRLNDAQILGDDATQALVAMANQQEAQQGFSLAAYGYGDGSTDTKLDLISLFSQRTEALQQQGSPQTFIAQSQQMENILQQLQSTQST